MIATRTVTKLPVRRSYPVERLPFVHDATPGAKDGNKGRTFWHVQSTGDYGLDWLLGEALGKEAVKYMAGDPAIDVIVLAVSEMCKLGRETTGVEMGFVSVIGKLALVGLKAQPDLIGGL